MLVDRPELTVKVIDLGLAKAAATAGSETTSRCLRARPWRATLALGEPPGQWPAPSSPCLPSRLGTLKRVGRGYWEGKALSRGF
jgi:hypothetical protein